MYGRDQELEVTLTRLRGEKFDVLEEAAEIRETVEISRRESQSGIKDLFQMRNAQPRIDAAIWNNEVPGDIQELALTLNHVCQRRCNDQTKAVIMTLMMSVKSACQLGWFPQRESQQLLALVDSMLKSFTGPENVASSLTPNGPISLIPQVIERFYPFLKLRHILVSSEADSESMVLVKNFDCSKNIVQHSPRPRDSRPQRPTNVAKLLHPGTNLLQIPHTYQKLPVKGHACKHLQILEEVGSNVTDVVISPDGSWKVVTENDEIVEAVRETRQHVDPSSSLRPAILDLTRDENEMETSGSTQIPMLNQSSASLPQLPQTLNVYDGQQQFMNFPVSAAREVIHMPFFPTSSPQDTNTGSSHIPMPAAHSSQFQGLHVSHLGLSLGRDSGMMERWNHNYAQLPPMPPQLHPQYLMQNQRLLPTRSVSPVQERPIPSSITYPQTFAFNYGGTSDQRHKQMPVQRHNPGGAGEQFSSAEFMNLTPDNSANRRLHIRIMRGSVTPGSIRFDHLIIQFNLPSGLACSVTSSNTSTTSANNSLQLHPGSVTSSSTSSFFGEPRLFFDGY
ncbi:hypothetical protein Bca4012_061797 [Brassica carinata]